MGVHDIVTKVVAIILTSGHYVVTGGARLAILGLRKQKDIDILVLPQEYERLRRTGQWSEVTITNQAPYDFKVLQSREFEAFTLEGFDAKYFNDTVTYVPNVAEIIETADVIDGISFINIEKLKEFKIVHGREKDAEDLGLIEKYENIFTDSKSHNF